jgi:hypothetical protein
VVVYMPSWAESAKPAWRRREGCAFKFSATRDFLSLPNQTLSHSDANELVCPGPYWKLVDAVGRAHATVGAELLTLLHGGTASTDQRLLDKQWLDSVVDCAGTGNSGSQPPRSTCAPPPAVTYRRVLLVHCLPRGAFDRHHLHNCHPWVVFGIYTIDPGLTLTRVRILGQTTKNAEVLAPAVNC